MSKAGSPAGARGARQAPPDRDQRDLITGMLDGSMLVEAAAGTGKTASMVDRMVAVLATGRCESIATLAAVTFTRKAASELRSRFRDRLDREARAAGGPARDRLEEALANIDRCTIGTIHSFCARLLRERPVEAGIDIAFEEIEPEEDMRLRKEAWDGYAAEVFARDPDGLLPRLGELGMTLSELENAYVRYADFPDVDEWPVPDPEPGPLDLAPALDEILAYVKHMGECEPMPDDEGKGRLVTEYRRIPGIARRTDRDDPAAAIDLIALFDRRPPSMSREQRTLNLDFARAEQSRWKRVCEEFAHPVMEEVYSRRYRLALEILSRARARYDGVRASRGKLNYQDLLMKSADLLRDKPHVREYFGRRFTHLMVDEFQDTDPIQAQVMLFLTAADPRQTDWRKCRPRPGSLFVVGDPKQSIYRFRRADIVTYNAVRDIIERHGEVVRLSANFRARGELIGWSNEVFEDVFPDTATAESPAFVPLLEGRAPGEPGDFTGVRLIRVPGELCEEGIDPGLEHEADLIARTIKDAIDGGKRVPRLCRPGEEPALTPAGPDDFMIIAFNKDYLSVYARKLQEYGIPHEVSGGTALNEVAELRLLHLCLDAITQPDNPVSLLAVLRSELFGVSDAALYAFKREGGRFDYNSEVPATLPREHAAPIGDAFAKLKEYSLQLRRMPPAPAIERIVADLGLMVLAAAREGGDVQAGGVAKALELMRAMRGRMQTTAELTDYLGGIIDPGTRSESFDGMSVLSERKPVVRVMNLHKAKGLQAPVVFLASPRTRWGEGVDTFIDRSEGKVRGYLGIGIPTAYGGLRPRARPPGWDDLKNREKAFVEAEADRLRYVAVTRAESLLVVSSRDDDRGKSIWKPLAAHIEPSQTLPDPGPARPRAPELTEVRREDVLEATAAIQSSLESACAPTCSVRAAKEYALRETRDVPAEAALPVAISFAPAVKGDTAFVPDGEHGVEWGDAVHHVLELAARNPSARLGAIAEASLDEAGIDRSRSGDLIDTVKAVMASEIWRRAGEADLALSEVPFEVVIPQPEAGGPGTVLIRGSIDLAFREKGGWVIVDYKTDSLPPDGDLESLARKYHPQVELYARALERCTGEPVKQTALYFIRENSVFWHQV